MFTKVIVVILVLGGGNMVYGESFTEFTKCIGTTAVPDIAACVTNNLITGITIDPNAALKYYLHPESICSQQVEYIKLVDCLITATLKCATDDDLKSLIPTFTQYEDAFKYFCGRISSFNGTCYSDAVVELATCVTKKLSDGGISPGDSFGVYKSYICSSSTAETDCYSENTALQNCMETKTTMVEMLKKEKPPACGSTLLYYTTSLIFLSMLMSKLFSVL